jgi:RNA polymerase sigma factor (sigma-70 family)
VQIGTRRRSGWGQPVIDRVTDALAAWFAPSLVLWTSGDAALRLEAGTASPPSTVDADALVARLFTQEGHALVRLARLFVDDRNAAEDLVQEAFIRLARNAHRIQDTSRAPAYLRSIVLNLARDHNRRGLMSLRHHEPADVRLATVEDELELRDDQRRVIEALQELPRRQRDCVVLRYHFEAGIPEIAATLGISANSVKTHLKRGLAALERNLAGSR